MTRIDVNDGTAVLVRAPTRKSSVCPADGPAAGRQLVHRREAEHAAGHLAWRRRRRQSPTTMRTRLSCSTCSAVPFSRPPVTASTLPGKETWPSCRPGCRMRSQPPRHRTPTC